MRSAGNDIVAIQSINSERSNNSRFYTQILSDTEESLYSDQLLTDLPFEHFLWLAWSVKESVYKFLKRIRTDLVFSPTGIVIEQLVSPEPAGNEQNSIEEWEGFAADLSCYTGTVIFEGARYFFKTKIYSELIATVISEDGLFTGIAWGIQKIEAGDRDTQSTAVRSFLLNRLSASFPGKAFTIQKSPVGYPVILLDDKELAVPVSFSHHYSYVSYCFLLEFASAAF